MTYEALPPEVSPSGRVVVIDGGKASELARIGNKAEATAYAEAMAHAHPNNSASRGAHGPAGGARRTMTAITPAAEAWVQPRRGQVGEAHVAALPGLGSRPGDSATIPDEDKR